MTGDRAAGEDRSSGHRDEIDELLEDLVYRHESDEHRAVPGTDLSDRGLPERSRRASWHWVLAVFAGAGLLALAFAGGFLAFDIVSPGAASRSDERPAGSSTTTRASDRAAGTAAPAAGSPTAGVAAAPPTSSISDLRLGIVLPGGATDLAFSQSMADGAAALVSSGSAGEISVVENVGAGGAREELRRFADDGYDIVIAHSSAFEAAVFDLAPQYPDVVFAVAGSTDPVPLDNVYTYLAAAEEGGYLLGALGAMLSPSGVLGVVGPAEVGVSKRYVDGFRRGALDERADAAVLVSYTGSFSDPAAFTEAAERHLDDRADVITGHGQDLDAAIGVVAARDAIWLGSQSDHASVSPEAVVASQVYHWEVVLGPIVAEVEAGEVDGRHLRATLANGGIVITYNEARLPSGEIVDRAEALRAEISSGSLRPLDGR